VIGWFGGSLVLRESGFGLAELALFTILVFEVGAYSRWLVGVHHLVWRFRRCFVMVDDCLGRALCNQAEEWWEELRI